MYNFTRAIGKSFNALKFIKKNISLVLFKKKKQTVSIAPRR